MDIGTLSFRYAKALFSLAKDKGLEEQVYENMKMLSDSFLRERSLQEALVNPLVSTAAKEKLLVTAGGIKVCDLYVRFIRLVLGHKRESYLLFFARSFIDLYRKEKKITRVLFTTAVPGRVNPDLIGGFQLQIGNYRLDTSYASQLRNIRNQLLNR